MTIGSTLYTAYLCSLFGYGVWNTLLARYPTASVVPLFALAGTVLIALTGWKQASDRILATLAGFDHHVAKPYDPGVLLQLVRNVHRLPRNQSSQ